MANTISSQTISDSDKNLILQIDIVGDGSGDESATQLVDISSFNVHSGQSGAPTECRILGIESTLEGFTAQLLWDATTDVEAFLLPQLDLDRCFKRFGGLKNNAGTGKTGDINITTDGLGANDQGTIILHLRKMYG